MGDLTNYDKRTLVAQSVRDQVSSCFQDVHDGKEALGSIRPAIAFASMYALSEGHREALRRVLDHHDHIAVSFKLNNSISLESGALYLDALDRDMRADGDGWVPTYFTTKLSLLFNAGKKGGRTLPGPGETDVLKGFATFLGEAIGSDKDVKQATPVRPIMLQAISDMLHRSSSSSLRDRTMLVLCKVLLHTGARSCEFTDNCVRIEDVTLLAEGAVAIRLKRTKSNVRPIRLLLHPLGEGAASVCGARALHAWVPELLRHHHQQHSSYLFPAVESDSFTSSHWAQTTFSNYLKVILRRAGCAFLYVGENEPTGHGFRRAVTTIAEEEGVDPEYTTRYLRWSAIMSLCRVRYTHSNQVVSAAVAAALTSAYEKEVSLHSATMFSHPSHDSVISSSSSSAVAASSSSSLASSSLMLAKAPSWRLRRRQLLSVSSTASESPSPIPIAAGLPPSSRALSPSSSLSVPSTHLHPSLPIHPAPSPCAMSASSVTGPLDACVSPRSNAATPSRLKRRLLQKNLRMDDGSFAEAGYGVGYEQFLLAQPLPSRRVPKPIVRYGQ